MKGRHCRQCGRVIRGEGVHLYDTPTGAVYLCRRAACMTAYNDGEPAAAPRRRSRRRAA